MNRNRRHTDRKVAFAAALGLFAILAVQQSAVAGGLVGARSAAKSYSGGPAATGASVERSPGAAKIVFDSSPSRRERLRNQITQVKRLSLSDLEIARPLEMLREPVLGYLMELLTGMQPLSALGNPPKATTSVSRWYLETGSLRRRLAVLARCGVSWSRKTPSCAYARSLSHASTPRRTTLGLTSSSTI